MRSILLTNLPRAIALLTLYAIGWMMLWRRARRAAAATSCAHEREVLVRDRLAVIEFRCLDCQAVRQLGHVYFGASNHKAKGHIA